MPEKPKNKKIIMVLEDERQLAKAIRDAFVERGFETIMVASVDDGLKELANIGHVDVIWLDHYLLGTGNGLDFVVEIKNNTAWKDIPIFVVSNDASSTNVRAYLQLGVDNYYTKADYDIGQIISDIEYAMSKRSA
jgi:DNA-binding response OmpR family regulator